MNKKKKILIVHNYYKIPGGEDSVVANEKEMLEEHGHEVVLYSRNNMELNEMSRNKKMMLPVTTVFNPRTYREVLQIIRKQQIDIVHVHNTLSLISPSVYYAAFRCKIPVVQTIHNFRLLCPAATFFRDGHICEECVEQGLMRAIKHSCYRGSKLQTLACVVCTKLHRKLGTYRKLNYICLTDFNKEKLLQLNKHEKKQLIDPSKVYIKPNFVKTNEKIIPYADRLDQYIYVGRLDKLKGIDILFEVWKLMGNSAPKLVVCGNGPMEEWCQNFLKEHPNCNIEMLGYVSNAEAKKLIARAKALILPTQWYEGFPMTIVEAYSAGTPVIGSNIGNVSALIIEGVTGTKFQYDQAESLISAIQKMKTYKIQEENFCADNLKGISAEENYRILLSIYNSI